MSHYSLTPLLRHSIGFDRFNQLFDAMTKVDETAPTYPPYNIEKIDAHDYRITMAVAGFAERDLNLVQEGDTLTVRGKIETVEKRTDEKRFLHKGIATRSFERKFNLADHVRVTSANLENGLLVIDLKQEIPETAKPRMIEIGGSATPTKK